MNETIQSRLTRLTRDLGRIDEVDMLLKCKTRDGMIYTLEVTEFRTEGYKGEIPFAGHVDSSMAMALISAVEQVAKEGYWFSGHEMAAIRHDEIVRLWVEIGDVYYNGPIEE